MFSFPINDAVYTACFMGCGVYKLLIERLCDAVRSGFVFVIILYSSVWLRWLDFPARKSSVFQYLYVFVLWSHFSDSFSFHWFVLCTAISLFIFLFRISMFGSLGLAALVSFCSLIF